MQLYKKKNRRNASVLWADTRSCSRSIDGTRLGIRPKSSLRSGSARKRHSPLDVCARSRALIRGASQSFAAAAAADDALRASCHTHLGNTCRRRCFSALIGSLVRSDLRLHRRCRLLAVKPLHSSISVRGIEKGRLRCTRFVSFVLCCFLFRMRLNQIRNPCFQQPFCSCLLSFPIHCSLVPKHLNLNFEWKLYAFSRMSSCWAHQCKNEGIHLKS